MVPGRLERTGVGKGRACRGTGLQARARGAANPCRWNAADGLTRVRTAVRSRSTGSKPEFGLPRGGHVAVLGRQAQAAAGWCQGPKCMSARTVLMRRQGALCPARTTADRKIAPDASFVLGRGQARFYWEFGGARPVVPTIRLRATAGTPSACRSLMSRPDNTARRRRRLRFPDDNLGITPPPPRQMDFGTFSSSFVFKGLSRRPDLAAGHRGFESRNRPNRVGL